VCGWVLPTPTSIGTVAAPVTRHPNPSRGTTVRLTKGNRQVTFVGMDETEIPAITFGRAARPLTPEQVAEAQAIAQILAVKPFAASGETFTDTKVPAEGDKPESTVTGESAARKAGSATVYRMAQAKVTPPDGKIFGVRVWTVDGTSRFAITLRDKPKPKAAPAATA
jgi:hypothetical protein